MLTSVRLGIVLGFALFLFACGGGGGDNNTVTQIEVAPAQANLSPGQTVQFTATAKTASGKAVTAPFTWQSNDPSIATVDANGVATGHAIGVTGMAAASGPISGSATLGVVSPASGSPNLTVSGTAQYQDKPFDKNGFITGPPVQNPIRGAIINLIAIDGFATLGTGATGEDGTFSFTGINNASRRGGLYLQVVSKTDPANPTQVEIRDNPDNRALFALASPGLDDSATASFPNITFTATAASGIGGAFNSLDVFSRADELIRSGGPCNTASNPAAVSPTSPCIPPLLTAYWEPGNSNGTFYDNSQNAIFILGGGTADGDTDEYDDSVIAHEYGHFIMAYFSHDNSPGGVHVITDNAEDIRLAYSEGWGNFFSSAVRNSPLYVDTANQRTFSFELEGLTSSGVSNLPAIAVYDTHELAVAAVLWDIFDPADDDPLSLGFTPVWQAVLQIPAASTATFESFWLTFASLNLPGNNSNAAGLQEIMRERKIELFPDAPPDPLTPNAEARHRTLYKSDSDPTGDVDVIPLKDLIRGRSYTVETFNLINGTDTLLSITDASNTPIPGLLNDNRNGVNYQRCDSTGQNAQGTGGCPPNDATTLSSSIVFNAPATGTFNARVTRSPAAPPSAGLFGSYNIRLKEP